MLERSIIIELASGLQAKPAAVFVQEANRFQAHLFLEKDGKRVNAKSIMGVMSLAIARGESINLIAEGNDAEEAIALLTDFVKESASSF